ncbi:hypothetical protein DFH08DRAFT_1021040 [Mycena albidolilacea]|uniref:Novel STAND NTPase 1 domain-containing protein n=1 Tax=Mycena albidolilacea TaxID=1033008 RepID=A0AAD6ZPM7_9AGAR|nr:hypothetical protein DFH08DRAFT_1021040 [Mycena albidolilacea]
MPRQPTAIKRRVSNAAAGLEPALALLKEINNAFGPPFVQPIANTIETFISMAQNVKRNKEECAQLMETTHQILYTIIKLYLKSETVESLAPAVLDNIGKFLDTLHKIYTFLEAQQEGNKLKHLFHNNQMQNLLKGCHAGLDHAMEVFEITPRPAIFNDIDVMKETANHMHQELLELIQTLSDASTSSDGSSMNPFLHSLTSLASFSMLPGKPKIFHGRESEVEKIMKMMSQQSARIAILGGGGMGKTSLAKAILHHPDIGAKFEHRFFVSAEGATTSIELAALIGLHVGLNPGTNLTRPVVQYLSQKPSCLLILDNLETVWEPMQSRGGIEEFLLLLTEVKHLTLLITMRGSERPGKVHWTHPFLLPLQPLSAEAAQQTFMDITDNAYIKEDMEQIFQFTDNMPLAVDLIAHLCDYEGLSNVLARWQTERTSLLSLGYDRKSNVDVSISLSLSSPRITSESKELLSLLSILPDGLSDGELVQYKLPIQNILSCKSALLATSLAYQDGKRRLRLLMPMREYVQKFLPPSLALVQCLCKQFYALLELYQKYKKYNGEQLGPVINQIELNLGNFHQVLQQGLYNHALDLGITMHSISFLNSFHRFTGRGYTVLLDSILPILPGLDDPQLQLCFIIEVLISAAYNPSLDREQFIMQAPSMLEHINNPLLECQFYHAAGTYFQYRRSDIYHGSDIHQALQFYSKALDLSRLCQDTNEQCNVLLSSARLKYRTGDYRTAQADIAKALALYKSAPDLVQEANALFTGALCSIPLGNFLQAMDSLHRSRMILGICGLAGANLDHGLAILQGEIHLLKSEYAQARSIHSQIVATASRDPNEYAYAYAISLLNIAHIDAMCGDTRDMYHKLNQAKEIFNKSACSSEIMYCNTIEADIELREKKFDLAKIRFQECLHSTWGVDNEVESLCLERLADITAWPSSEWQFRWPVTYLGYAYKTKDNFALHKALLYLGDVFIINKDGKTAENLYMLALEGFTQMDVHCSRAQCMIHLGDLANEQGHTSKAICLWQAARPLFERSLQATDVAQIDVRLSAAEKCDQEALTTLTAPDQWSNTGSSEIQQVESVHLEGSEGVVSVLMPC